MKSRDITTYFRLLLTNHVEHGTNLLFLQGYLESAASKCTCLCFCSSDLGREEKADITRKVSENYLYFFFSLLKFANTEFM